MIRDLETRLSSKDRANHLARRKQQIALEKKKLLEEEEEGLGSMTGCSSKDKDGSKQVDVVDWFLSQVSLARLPPHTRRSATSATSGLLHPPCSLASLCGRATCMRQARPRVIRAAPTE